MDRRGFIKQGLVGSAVVAGSGGALFVRRSQARESLKTGMLDDALPPFTATANAAATALPVKGREKIREFFHGKCLNVESFVTHVCSPTFQERLGRARSPAEKHNCFTEAFCARVASEAVILQNVDMIATDIGAEIDDEWNSYCLELSGKWHTRIRAKDAGGALSSDSLNQRMTGLVRSELQTAALDSIASHQSTALGETVGKIGKSAIQLLPLAKVGKVGIAIAVPVFFVLAAKHVWDYSMSRLDDRRGDYIEAITTRMSTMANRVAGEFEKEVRQRIDDLHTWQERSIRDTADRIAQEKVGLL